MKAIKEIIKIIEANLEFYYSKNETPNVFEFVLKVVNNDTSVSSFILSHGYGKMAYENIINNPSKYFSFSVEGEMDNEGKKIKNWSCRKDALEEDIELALRCELEVEGFISCECGLKECSECNSNNWNDSEEKIVDLIFKKHARENF